MLEMLDNRFASNRTATRISVLTAMYTKRFNYKQHLPTYIDEFESLFAQLERMGTDNEIPEFHKAPLLLSSMGNNSPLESTVAALRTKDTDQLTWEDVTSDLIQERTKWKSRHNKHRLNSTNNNRFHDYDKSRDSHSHSMHTAYKTNEKNHQIKKCSFCGKSGHESNDCFLNPKFT